MPYRCKDSLIWWVSYSDPSGQRIRRSTETTNRREARALEAKWKLEAHNSKQWGQQPSRTFEHLMLGYLRAKSDEKRPWGFRRDLDATRHLKAYYIGWDLADITPGSVRGYIARRRNEDVSDLTVKRELCVLSAAFNYARTEWEWDLRNPVPGRKLKEPEGRIRWITHTEAAALIQVAEIEPQAPHLADFIRLALHTGCRKGELLGLEWSRVDLQANLVYLDSTRRENDVQFRSIRMHAMRSSSEPGFGCSTALGARGSLHTLTGNVSGTQNVRSRPRADGLVSATSECTTSGIRVQRGWFQRKCL